MTTNPSNPPTGTEQEHPVAAETSATVRVHVEHDYQYPAVDDAELLMRFTYAPPFGNQPQRYEYLRKRALDLARHITGLTPPSREQSLALSHLEQVVMWANAAIARRETRPDETADEEPAP